MTTELETAMASLRSALPDDETDHGHVVIESDAIRSVLAALSTPPADDVREALDHLDVMNESGRIAYADYVALHDMVSRIEVRPRGTVTAEAREAEMRELHHFEVEQQLAETIAIVKRAQAVVLRHEHTPASLHMEDILNEVNTEIPSAAEVRPYGTVTDALYCAHCQNDDHANSACEARGTVTDTAEPYEYCVVNGLGRGIYMAKTLEEAREGIAKDQRVGPGELRPKRSIVRRRRAGKWETFS